MATETSSSMATETSSCDYLVVGAGASGMSFVDTLLLHAPEPVSVTLLDKREQPGGHWNDAYDYVTLHQPARNYGVESTALEAFTQHPEKLASRDEILDYYRSLLSRWGEAGHRVSFVGGATYDFGSASYVDASGSRVSVDDASKVVDARYTENDLPLLVPPKFSVGHGVDLIPPNELPARGAGEGRRYCVLGGGKTGQDAVLFLRQTLGVPIDRIAWVVPHLPWITARDPPSPLRQNTCIEFIASALEAHAAAGSPPSALSSSAFLQSAFAKLEEEGKVYRILTDETPTKFMDATLSRREAELLRESAPSIIRGRGRVASISSTGDLVFADGSELALPWANEGGRSAAKLTTYVHCTAGAFNFGASAAEGRRPVFSSEREITVQELFQFPGFCFNGAVVAWLECQRGLSLAQKNALCELPPPPEEGEAPPLGPVAGQVGPLSAGHPLLVSLRNLRRWYATPGMGEWLHGLRLFSLAMNGYSLAEGRALVEKNCDGLVEAGLLTPPEEERR